MSRCQDMVLQYIREHPGSSSREIQEILFPDINFMTNKKVCKICSSLHKYGLIRNEIRTEETRSYGYTVIGKRARVRVARWYQI